MRASEYTVGNIEYHSNLNPVAWHGDQLRIEIRYRLLKIANTFVNYLEIPNFKILDIVLTGSLANYNWTKYSDFDIHVVTDYASDCWSFELTAVCLLPCRRNQHSEPAQSIM